MTPEPRVHRKSYDVEWQPHALTFSCFGRRPFFSGKRSPRWFLEVLNAARQRVRFDLWAFVIMPEHVHLVLLPAPGVLIRQILWQIKRPMTERVLNWVRRTDPRFLSQMADRQPNGKLTYRFWQRGGGYDRNLRTAQETHEKIKYTHDNPVRRGLVEKSEDWPWSSARAWLEGTGNPLRLDLDSLPPLYK
jgi:putative transposase